MPWFDILHKSATAGAALVGAWVAFQGLTTWRRQLHGNAEYELARRLLRSVFKVRDQISFVRAPFVSVGEMMDAYKAADVDPKDVDLLNDGRRRDQLVYQRRWEPLATAISDLAVDVLEGEVLWGPQVKTLEQELHAVVGELSAALWLYFRDVHAGGPRDDKAATRLEQQYNIVYGHGRDNEFQHKVASVVSAFETTLRPHLQSVSVSIATRAS